VELDTAHSAKFTDNSCRVYNQITLTPLISYEDKQLVRAQASPAGVLRFLMNQHGLAQADLPEVGSQGVLSEILSGKRALNVRQIRALAERFAISPTVFLKDQSGQ
jgi:HTH-type transcriptional regulator/antitoxin HigA